MQTVALRGVISEGFKAWGWLEWLQNTSMNKLLALELLQKQPMEENTVCTFSSKICNFLPLFSRPQTLFYALEMLGIYDRMI